MTDLIIATRPYTQPQPGSYNPYIEMAMRVMDSALKMETEAKSVAKQLVPQA